MEHKQKQKPDSNHLKSQAFVGWPGNIKNTQENYQQMIWKEIIDYGQCTKQMNEANMKWMDSFYTVFTNNIFLNYSTVGYGVRGCSITQKQKWNLNQVFILEKSWKMILNFSYTSSFKKTVLTTSTVLKSGKLISSLINLDWILVQ